MNINKSLWMSVLPAQISLLLEIRNKALLIHPCERVHSTVSGVYLIEAEETNARASKGITTAAISERNHCEGILL